MARGNIVTRKVADGSKRYDACIRIEGRKKYKTFKLKNQAEAWLDRNSTDLREHTYREITPSSFRQYTDKWRKKYLIVEELKPSTLGGYACMLDRHLVPAFGHRPMAAITTGDITELRSELIKGHGDVKAQSSQSVKKIMNLLNRICGDAIEDGFLRVSPMPTRRRKSETTKASRRGRALQPSEAQRLLEQCETNAEEDREANPILKLTVLIGLLAGLRRGEIFALDWESIDWERDLIRVSRNLFWRYGKHYALAEDEPSFVIHEPKSATSSRDVDLSPTLKKELRIFYLQCKSKHRSGLIFRSRENTPLDPHNVYERWFKPAVERARLKAAEEKDESAVKALDGLHIHDLRHTFGSWKVAQGEDILYVSKQMGHARPSITADVYSHLLEKQRPQAAQKTDDFLFGTKATTAG